MTATADLMRLKKELQTLKIQDPKGFDSLMNEIDAEKEEEISDSKENQLDKTIDKHFLKYEEVFKALA
jgi:hypothetical protein